MHHIQKTQNKLSKSGYSRSEMLKLRLTGFKVLGGAQHDISPKFIQW
ncbi:hypothetical protein PULV_b0132 [Pseudoalteromonas ulvae UL12]|nr:hypothetical protein [Pseudoalteromonas ulvae UL12]